MYNDKYDLSNIGTGLLNIKKYDYTYIFGKFTGIFTPDFNNDVISQKMDVIIEKLGGKYNADGIDYLNKNKPVPVFILGYGACGSGNTSSLIYSNKGKDISEKTGILVYLCNRVSSKGNQYNQIKLKCKEFYHVMMKK